MFLFVPLLHVDFCYGGQSAFKLGGKETSVEGDAFNGIAAERLHKRVHVTVVV